MQPRYHWPMPVVIARPVPPSALVHRLDFGPRQRQTGRLHTSPIRPTVLFQVRPDAFSSTRSTAWIGQSVVGAPSQSRCGPLLETKGHSSATLDVVLAPFWQLSIVVWQADFAIRTRSQSWWKAARVRDPPSLLRSDLDPESQGSPHKFLVYTDWEGSMGLIWSENVIQNQLLRQGVRKCRILMQWRENRIVDSGRRRRDSQAPSISRQQQIFWSRLGRAGSLCRS